MAFVAPLLLAAGVTAAPVLDAFALPCSGNGGYTQAAGASLVGKCYSGSASVLTISETAILQVKSFDPATGEGTMRLDAEGVATVHCPPATFKTQAGSRDLIVDLTACGKIKRALATAEYCSDQDTIRVHVKVPDTAAPGASNLPLIPVTLKPTVCKDAHADLKSTK